MKTAIIAGCRTPFARSGSVFADLTAIELGKIAVRDALGRSHGGIGLPFAGDPAGFVPPNPLETIRRDGEPAEDSRPADSRTINPIAATEK